MQRYLCLDCFVRVGVTALLSAFFCLSSFTLPLRTWSLALEQSFRSQCGHAADCCVVRNLTTSPHGQKFATGSGFDPDPRTRIHSCRGLRGRRHARTASIHHVHGQSRKRNQEFLFQGIDLVVIFFFCISFPSNPLRATSFFVCLRRLCLRRSPGVMHVLRLSLTHSLPFPSQIRAVSTFLLVLFVSKRVREARGFVQSMHELQRY